MTNEILEDYGPTLEGLYPGPYRTLLKFGHGPFRQPVDRMLQFVCCVNCCDEVYDLMRGMYTDIGMTPCTQLVYPIPHIDPPKQKSWLDRLKKRFKIDR